MAEKRKAETQIESASPKIIRTEVGKYFTAQPFRDLLVRSSVESLAYKKEKGVVFFVDRTDKVSDVFKGLVKHNFLSVPVLQKTKHKWYGFIEAGDIVQFYVDHFGDQLGDEGQKVWDVIAKREGFMDKTVGDVMKHPLSRKNPFHPITVGYSLYYALETLAREENLHRVPIIDSERNLKSVLSLSQVIEFIHENINMLGSIKDKPLKDVHGVLKPVVTVNENERAIDAFKVMQTKSIGGVAVVNDEGKVTGNLSERDLKAVRLEHQLFHRLFQKVHNFIRHLREEFQQEDHRPKTKQVLHIDDTLEHAIAVLMSNGIHRSYIVDADHKPIGVVSLKDILLEIINN